MSPEKSAAKETVAIIGGTGDLGFGLALRWASAGVPIVIGSREPAKAEQAARRLLEKFPPASRGGRAGSRRSAPASRGILAGQDAGATSVSGLENSKAAAQASIVVLAVPFPAQIAILKSIRESFNHSIFVDTTVPLAATIGGKPTRMLGLWQGSAAEQARELVPSSIPVLSAFHNVSAEALQDSTVQLDCDILVCGEDPAAKQRLFALIKLIPGLRPVDAGPLEMARVVESLTALLISLNRQYKVQHAGIRITGLPATEPQRHREK